jgi:hypothetical protein
MSERAIPRRRRLQFTGTLLACASTLLLAGCTSLYTGRDLLHALQEKRVEVLRYQRGSRPRPPAWPLRKLIGINRDEVGRVMGEPDGCGPDSVLSCKADAEWHYDWGPPNPEPDHNEEGGYFSWLAGGPWLLVMEFSGDRVAAARWVEQ